MADDNKQTKITVSADIDPAKQSLNELIGLVEDAQRGINKAFNASQNNNGQLSNRQLANAQNGIGRINDARNILQQEIDGARATQSGSQLEATLNNLAPKYEALTQAINKLTSNNAGKLNVINNSRTSSSRAFRVTDDTTEQEFAGFRAGANAVRSDTHNLNNYLHRENNNLEQSISSKYISHNRYKQYQASVDAGDSRIKELQKIFDPTNNKSEYNLFNAKYKKVRSQAQAANRIASRSGATTKEIAYARALDEQVKELDKTKQKYDDIRAELSKTEKAWKTLSKNVNAVTDNDSNVKIGLDPNSFWGALQKRSYTIGRGALAAGVASIMGANSNGNNLRLSNFDNIKSTMYGTGMNDRQVMNRLGDAGYAYGYSGADMSQFANAYTSSTGNVGSVNGVSNVARTWAEQSRVTGGTQQSTLALEQAAGNSANLNSSQMKSVGNAITNAITSSGMSAKASEQQQGLAMLYQNGAAYGMNATNERDMAGLQASLSRYGSQFQGTQGAQTIMQLTQGLGNYNNPGMRQLFANGNPRYTGVDGSARLMEDMQNMNKDPKAMSRILTSAEKSFGGDRLHAAQYLSANTNVSMDTLMKLMKANDNGALNKSTLRKYTNDSSQANKNRKGYEKSGGAALQKQEAALADSAMKASQALDIFRNTLAKLDKMGGGLSPLAGGIGSALGSGAISAIGGHLMERGLGKLATSGAKGGFRGILGDVAGFILGDKGPKGGAGAGKVAEEAEKGAKGASKIKRAGSLIEKVKDLKDVSKLGRFGSKTGKLGKIGRFAMRGAKAVGRSTDVGDILLGGADLVGAFATTKKGTRARHRAVGSSIGGTAGGILGGAAAGAAAGSVFGGVGAIPGSIIGGILGGFGGEKLGGLIGGMFGGSRRERAMRKAKGESLSEARKTAGKYNRHEAENPSLLRRAGRFALKHRKGLLLGAAGAGLAGLFGETAHASSRKHGKTSEAWKILRGYNKMLDHAMRVVQAAKSIKNGGDSSKSDDGGDISGTGGKGDKAIRSIAKAVAKKLGVDPKLVYAQLAYESTDGTSQEAVKDNNFAGIKGSGGGAATDDGGIYQHFNSTDDFANAYANILRNDGVHSGMSVEDWANTLHAHHYFTDDPSHYAAGLKTYYDKYATGGIRYHATGGPLITDIATTNNGTDVYGEAGTEAYVPLNAGHYQDGLSTIQQLAGMFGKKLVDQSKLGGNRATTINPSYNINLTIQGGTDDAQGLAQTVANKVRQMLQQYDNSQQVQNQQMFYSNETSGLFA